MKRLLILIAVAAPMLPAAWAKFVVAFRLASPPLPVEAGQQFSLCAANVGRRSVDLQLEFFNVRTGAVVSSRMVTLPPPGSGAMPDPCLSTTAEAITSARNPPTGEPPLVVGLVVIRRGVFSGASAATASVQVTAGAGAGRHLVASIPLHLATMVNGRNTPIETVP